MNEWKIRGFRAPWLRHMHCCGSNDSLSLLTLFGYLIFRNYIKFRHFSPMFV